MWPARHEKFLGVTNLLGTRQVKQLPTATLSAGPSAYYFEYFVSYFVHITKLSILHYFSFCKFSILLNISSSFILYIQIYGKMLISSCISILMRLNIFLHFWFIKFDIIQWSMRYGEFQYSSSLLLATISHIFSRMKAKIKVCHLFP